MNLSFFIREHRDEQVLYQLRRHPLVFIPYVLLFLFLVAVPVLLYLLFSNLFPQILEVTHALYPVLVLAGSAYYLVVLLLFFGMFIDFYLDLWIVTNDRVVDVEQFGLLSRSISEVELFRIQDVTAEMHGLFQTMFHFGDVTIKTASNSTGIVFRKVRHPNFIRSELIRLAEADRKKHYHTHLNELEPK